MSAQLDAWPKEIRDDAGRSYVNIEPHGWVLAPLTKPLPPVLRTIHLGRRHRGAGSERP